MPTFDIVSEVDWQEVNNAINQANKEIGNRYDFKGSEAKIDRNDTELVLAGEDAFRVEQMREILQLKLAKRGVDLGSLVAADTRQSPTGKAVQTITVQHGVDTESARAIVKSLKQAKFKAQTSIQGAQIRVTAKKRDELQQIIAYLREQKFALPLQYINFRD